MDFSLTTLFVLPNASLVPANFKRENLKPTQFGVFNSRYKAVVDAAGANASPYIVFGQGRIENVPGLTHKYSDKLNKASLIEWNKTEASPTAKSQITFAGYDGVDETKTLKAGPDEQYSLTVRARSLYIDNAYAYGLTRTVTVTTPCGADCGNDCETIDARILANLYAEALNKEPLLQKFIVATPVISCTTAPAAADVENVVIYHGVRTDDGDAFALAAVQALFPDDDVSLVSHVGGVSTYKIVRLAADLAPVDGNGIDWSAAGTAFKVKQTLVITVATADAAATLAELQAQNPDSVVTQLDAANGNAQYQLVQTSTSIHTDASMIESPKFAQVQGVNGLEWTVKAGALSGSGCVAGVKIEGKPLDKYGNPCDPIAFPHEFDRLTFEVFAYKGAATSQDDIVHDRCDNIPITTVQKATYATGSGEEIFMLEKRYNSEQTAGVAKHIYHNNTWNGGFVRYSDKDTFYDTFTLRFKAPDDRNWEIGASQMDETVIIAVPTGTGAAIETFITNYFGAEKRLNA